MIDLTYFEYFVRQHTLTKAGLFIFDCVFLIENLPMHLNINLSNKIGSD